MRNIPVVSDTANHNQISVGTSATLICAQRDQRRGILVVNHGTTDVYIGNSNVTTSSGILLTGTKGASISIPGNMAIYGIVGSGTQTISFIEIYY